MARQQQLLENQVAVTTEVTRVTLKVVQAPSHPLLCRVWRAARGRGTFFPGLCYPFAAHSVNSAKNNLKRRQRRLLNAHAQPCPPHPASRILPKHKVQTITKGSEKEEIQEFLKRVRKFSVGAVTLMDARLERGVTAEAARDALGQPGPILGLSCCFCSSSSASYRGQLVHFSTSCVFCLSGAVVVPQSPFFRVFPGNVCRILVLLGAGAEAMPTVQGMRLF